MIATLAWVAGGIAFAWVVIVALCRAAANGDILADPEPPSVEWSGEAPEVARMCEYRHRRDVKNGLGKAS